VAVAAIIDDAWWLNPFPAAVALVGLGVWLIAQGWTDEDDTSAWHRPWPTAPQPPGDAGTGAPGPQDAPTDDGAPGPQDAPTDDGAPGPEDDAPVDDGRPTTVAHPLAASPWVVSVSQHSDADGDPTTTLPSSPPAVDATDSPAPTGDAGPPAGAVPPPVSPWWSGAPAEGAAAPPPREPSPRPGRASRLGTTVVAVLLALGGGLWLVDSLEAVEVPWEGALAVGLLACGVGLIVASWRGRAYALLPASFLLALALAAGELLDVPLDAGMGDRVEVVDTTRELGRHHELFVGELSVDLSEAPLRETGTTTVEASVGMGELRVVVPRDAAVEVQARVGAGEIVSPGGPDANESGVGLDESFTLPGGRDGPRLQLELSMGAGSVEVVRD
jgi:hypothetical protein